MRTSTNLGLILYDIPDRWSNLNWNANMEKIDSEIQTIKTTYVKASNGKLTGNITIEGALNVTGNITGTLKGTADEALKVDWSKIANKPSSYPASSHTHPYLPLAGGTLTGQLTLPALSPSVNCANTGSSWISAGKGYAVLNSECSSDGSFTAFFRQNVPSIGAFTFGVLNGRSIAAAYFNKATRDGTANATTKQLILMDTAGGSSFPGSMTVNGSITASGSAISAGTTVTAGTGVTANNGNVQLSGTHVFYNNTYDGGIYMTNTSWVQTYKKGFYANGNISCSGVVINAQWNDYAEYYERGQKTVPGDIIALDMESEEDNRYIKATSYEHVVGVHSDSYGFIVGGDELPQDEKNAKISPEDWNKDKYIPVGMCGRVDTKVKGPVKRGDYITVSAKNPGVGVVTKERWTAIGFAVESNSDPRIKRVKINLF